MMTNTALFSPTTTISIPLITEREKEVLIEISFGRNTNAIAQKLYLSPHTICSHRKNLMKKLGVKNTAGLVRRGFELGLLS